ncbi:DNA cytosine methyltransferase [Kineococcus terrestris]|uniref:DNA cytosine methyltransferase n=1 Tax=Kineococcus terrestris TaxID=2044856 RepID=UPI0034DAEF0C
MSVVSPPAPTTSRWAGRGRTFRVLDLFAGCGGLTSGFVASGAFEPVGAVELDVDAAATYAVNFGEHVHVGDIAGWTWRGGPPVDVVVGGPPCQGFSGLGRRDPHDPRNVLWREYVRVLQSVRPAFFVLENVPLFLRSGQFALLEDETRPGGRLEGFRLEAHVLNAADYGVPQSRRRAVVVGRRRELPEIGPPPLAEASPVDLATALAGVPGRADVAELPLRSRTVNGAPVAGTYAMEELHVTRRVSDVWRRRYEAVPPGGSRHDLPHELRLPCWRGDFAGAGDVMGRLHWTKPSVTVRTEFFKPEKGRYLHPEEHRAITHYEAALLQGFPADFRWCGSKASIARQIGNAVPPPLARAIAEHLAARLC